LRFIPKTWVTLKAKAQRKPAISAAIKFSSDVPRHAGAARTKRWEAMVAYRKKHPRATLEDVIRDTPYTRGDYRLDIARGSLKA
jgi:hypothetical protein